MHFQTSVTLSATLCLAAGQSLKHVLASHGSLTMLQYLLEELELMATFESTQNSTILAMNDDAFGYLADWGMNLRSIDPEIARGIMKYHFLEGYYASTNPLLGVDTQLIHSILQPPTLTNVTDGAVVKLSGASDEGPFRVECGIQKVLPVIDADIEYDSGVLHTIGQNLVLPHNLSETTHLGNLGQFWSLVQRAQMNESLESLQDATILIPSNEAVERHRIRLESLNLQDLKITLQSHAIPNHVLYHMAFGVAGEEFTAMSGLKIKLSRDYSGRIFVNHARVLSQDVLIYGGIAHVLDDMLFPESGSALDSEIGGPWRYAVPLSWYEYPWKNTMGSVIGAGSLVILAALVIQRFIWRKAATYQRNFGSYARKEDVDEVLHFTSSTISYWRKGES